MILTPEAEVTYLNNLGAEFLGTTPASLQGHCLWDVMPQIPQDFPEFYDTYQRVLADRFPLTLDDYQLYSPQMLHLRFVPWDSQVLVYCRDITIQKQAQMELQYYSTRDELLVAIDQRIHQSLNLNEILQTAVEEIRQFLDADRALIYSVNAKAEPIELLAQSCADNLRIIPTLNPIPEGTTAIAPSPEPDLPPPIPPKSCVSVPIFQNQQRWGVLTVQQWDDSREWHMVEIHVLEELANRIAAAIQQSQLHSRVQDLNVVLEQRVQERTAQLEQAIAWEAMLKRITDRVRDSLDENQILEQAVKELATVLNMGSCNAALYNREQGTSTIYYEFVITMPTSQGHVAKMTDYPEIYNQLLQSQYFQFCSITPNPLRGHVAMLACPIFDDGGVLGDLWLVNHAEHAFEEAEIRFVQQAATQCAIALRQAKLYQSSQAQVAKLEEINRLKDEFLSTVSHELRTPMTNLKMAIRMLGLAIQQQQQTWSKLTLAPTPMVLRIQAKIDHYLSILKQECDREIQLINDLLDLQRLENGAQGLQVEPLDPSTWLPQQVQSFDDRARERQQTLHLHIAPNLPSLHTDRANLEGIVAELLNNACKYTPPGEHITLQAQLLPRDRLQIQVTNSGATISPLEQQRIFDKFYRIPSNDPWKQGGTGLGLALVQQRIQRLGGKIHVSSDDRQTCFTLELGLQPPWSDRTDHPTTTITADLES